jgi:hypothetical protein
MKLLLENWREYLEEERISVEDIHNRADKLGIPWDDNAEFMSWTKDLTGKSHLDKMTDEELSIIYTALKERDKEEEGLSRTEQYVKHAALNLGMAVRQGKGLISGDKDAKLKELVKDLYYTLVPPWTHHVDEELQDLAKNTVWKWFECGYMKNDEQYEEECL